MDTVWLSNYVDWLGKMESMLEKIHAAPRNRRMRRLKRCTKMMKKKGFSPEFIGVQMAPFFMEETD